jgi:hypothetical protein
MTNPLELQTTFKPDDSRENVLANIQGMLDVFHTVATPDENWTEEQKLDWSKSLYGLFAACLAKHVAVSVEDPVQFFRYCFHPQLSVILRQTQFSDCAQAGLLGALLESTTEQIHDKVCPHRQPENQSDGQSEEDRDDQHN